MLAGGKDEDRFVGGVPDLEGSLMVVECVEVISGERLGGVGCGIVMSNNSFRSSAEKVRLASSATRC